LVARTRDVLVIAEVRTRTRDTHGGAAASVNGRKQQRIIRAATQLLQQREDFALLPIRFDVIVVSGVDAESPKVEWIQHAFTA
jgi:putative endonuclease